MATATVIFRPCMDDDLGHSVNPSDSTNGYSLISEEICDEDTTYIYSSTTYESSRFRFKGLLPKGKNYKVTKVTANVFCYAYKEDTTDIATYEYFIYMHIYSYDDKSDYGTLWWNSVEIDTYNTWLKSSTLPKGYSDSYNQEFYDYLSEYLNSVSDPELFVEFGTNSKRDNNQDKSGYQFRTSQLYFEVELEYDEVTDIGVYKKVDGTWLAATQAFHKQNGAWVEITADECRNILQ